MAETARGRVVGRQAPLPHLAAVEAVSRFLLEPGIEGALIGGVAAIVWGVPRFTVDVDVLVIAGNARIGELLAVAARNALVPRIPDLEDFARKHRVLLLRHSTSDVGVDVSLGLLPFEQAAVRRARRVRVGGQTLRLSRPEDLVVMKAVAARPRDWEDIRRLADLHPRLAWPEIQDSVREFAEILDRPDIVASLDGIRKAAQRSRRSRTRRRSR